MQASAGYLKEYVIQGWSSQHKLIYGNIAIVQSEGYCANKGCAVGYTNSQLGFIGIDLIDTFDIFEGLYGSPGVAFW